MHGAPDAHAHFFIQVLLVLVKKQPPAGWKLLIIVLPLYLLI
jgi:hypothetical protein